MPRSIAWPIEPDFLRLASRRSGRYVSYPTGTYLPHMSDSPWEPLADYEEIGAPLDTGPHEVQELDSWFPWAVYECGRCRRKAWFRTDSYERVACIDEPNSEAADGE